MIKTFDLNNKIIIVTGGYGYLGKAITESLIFHGAIVYVIGLDSNKFSKAFNLLKSNSLFFENCNVGEAEELRNTFKKIYDIHGKIDVLINNAFYSKGKSPEEMTDDEWNLGIEGTLNSVFKCIREIIPFFKINKSGKIINVSSMYGIVAPQFDIYDEFPEFLNPPHYGAAKAGIIQLTKYYASYLGKHGITVNAISPGPFPSLVVQEKENFIKKLKTRTCLNKIGTPEDLAGSFVFLASEAANFITGQNLIIDGGWTCK